MSVSRLTGALSLVVTLPMAVPMAVPRPAHVTSEQEADDDHGQDERVLDEGLALVVLEADVLGAGKHRADPDVEAIHHEEDSFRLDFARADCPCI